MGPALTELTGVSGSLTRGPVWESTALEIESQGIMFACAFLERRFKNPHLPRGAWVAQSVKHPTLDSSSSHNLMVLGFKPQVGFCADSTEPAWDSLSLSLCPSPLRMLFLSQK